MVILAEQLSQQVNNAFKPGISKLRDKIQIQLKSFFLYLTYISFFIGLRTIYSNAETRLCLIQSRHGPHRLLASSLPFLTKIKNEKVVPKLIYTGATIRNCYKVRFLKLYRVVSCFTEITYFFASI